MTTGILPAPAAHQPAPPWTPTEHAARTDYLAAVQYAQQQYDADVQAAAAAYHRAEQLAWYAYLMNTRAAAQERPAPGHPGVNHCPHCQVHHAMTRPCGNEGCAGCALWPSGARPTPVGAPPQPQGTPTFTPKGRASCGHPAGDDGECSCSSWPQHAPYSISGDDQ